MTSTTFDTFDLAPDLTVTRMGYGAMQLAGPHVFGPPADRDAALAVLREVVALGLTHIDTSDFYGPHVTNELIREALHPYPETLHLVTKIGARRDGQGGWLPATSDDELKQAVEDNLERLGLDVLDVANFRLMPDGDGEIERPLRTLTALRDQGLIRHLGVSTMTAEHVRQARQVTEIVCVQNEYNLAHREDDDLIDELAADDIAYVPYFPLGGFSPLQSDALSAVAEGLGRTPMQIALAWLLQRSPNILLIPGTSSVEHLRENVAAAGLELSPEALAELDVIGR